MQRMTGSRCGDGAEAEASSTYSASARTIVRCLTGVDDPAFQVVTVRHEQGHR